jgi:hypothetical protein
VNAARRRLRTVAPLVGAIAVVMLSVPVTPADEPGARLAKSEGVERWKQIESVLTHPRCLNCHTATDYPRQADDRHPHQFRVRRGAEGKGVPGMLCATCHQAQNQVSSGAPGASGWHLAPLSMAWESAPGRAMPGGQLCRTLTDPKKNGGRNLDQLSEHFASEPLVLWGWEPGSNASREPRTTPPLSHAEFLDVFKQWALAGAPCPK